eukprot:CAMPEP_0113500466 /NCGR_PEP_ID=MMETSP0014_2-20120614/32346_1 /TAXON_ID=2857 /ORGANISM="Nitzschia sp." /LENGTH=332 /DNA_ID=CAMNT_0000394809 /DNA_START=175 /DNA_END=1173 /DNA_ORIENTATION=- /assembly_acc=CAM_ASM_000159
MTTKRTIASASLVAFAAAASTTMGGCLVVDAFNLPSSATRKSPPPSPSSATAASGAAALRMVADGGDENTATATATATTTEEVTKDEPVYFSILTEEGGPEAGSVAATTEGSTLSEAAQAATANVMSSYNSINGWVPKEDYALWGLPGAIAPTGFFDPLGFARQGLPLNDAKRLRESETQHGRVAMLAIVGYFVQENIMNNIGGGPFSISGPANDQLQQVPLPAFVFLTVSIAAAELYRAKLGWVEPKARIGSKTLFTLRDEYYPGDIGFDPLGLKPTENYEFQKMQTKELSHGRLAMIGIAGIMSQELVNHRTIAETWDFYSHLFAGDYSY